MSNHEIEKINDTTYKVAYNEDAEIEIGNIEKTDFEPHLKIKRWGEECYFSFKFPSSTIKNPEEKVNKLEWKDVKEEVHFYPLINAEMMEEGGFELEIILKEKPSKNTIDFDIESKDLVFDKQLAYDQRELSPEDETAGIVERTPTEGKDINGNVICKVPENMIDSIAVYGTKKNNKYKTGKAFHIHRLKATDSDDKEVWCDQDIINGNKYTITIPQEFLDTAVYPITIDPTFGYTSLGSGSFGLDDLMAGFVDDPGENGFVTQLHAGLGSNWNSGDKIKMALYDEPQNLVHPQSEEKDGGHGGTAWVDFDILTKAKGIVVSSQDYRFMLWMENNVDLQRDSNGTSLSRYSSSTPYGDWAVSKTFTHSLYRYSTYADYHTNPAISYVEKYGYLYPDEPAIDIDGINFGVSETGSAKVEFGDNADYGSCVIKTTQSVNSWSDSQINIDVSLGSLPEGQLWLYVTESTGITSTSYEVEINKKWGIVPVLPNNNLPTNWCRLLGGQSPNIDDMKLKSVSIFVGEDHDSQVRLAVYQGGTLDNPTGASLVYDFGITSGSLTDSWLTIDVVGSVSLTKDVPTWIAIKGNDSGFDTVYSTDSGDSGDFQSARGRFNSTGMSIDESAAYESTVPSGGSFSNSWYSTYLTYEITDNLPILRKRKQIIQSY